MEHVVELLDVDGGFVVRITENGETVDKTFENRAFAKSYANGQRIRLEATAEIERDQVSPNFNLLYQAQF